MSILYTETFREQKIPMARKLDWPWWKVKGVLEAAGTSARRVAMQNGFSASAGHKVKTHPIPRLQALIAAALDRRPQDIWPTRYDRRGEPVSQSAWRRNNKVYRWRHVQKREAA